MSSKKSNSNGIVYSTNPDFKLEDEIIEEQSTLPISEQKIRIKLDTKQRAGKAVTLIQGFVGTLNDIEDLGKKLKNFCGTGGSVKNNEIIIQGNNTDKILQWLHKSGYKLSKKI